MKIYRMDNQGATRIQSRGSCNAAFLTIARNIKRAHIGVMFLMAGGKSGFHRTAENQLFLVVQGSGWVMDEKHQPIEIQARQAV